MNQTLLAGRLGVISPVTFQQNQHERVLHSLVHETKISFSARRPGVVATSGSQSQDRTESPGLIAHQAGVNSLAIDRNNGATLVSGGADATIHLWDLEAREVNRSEPYIFNPSASLTRISPSSHTHGITSLSVYPFDPTPTTLLSTAYDKTFKLISITPTSMTPLHTFSLDFAPYTHSLSAIPSDSPLVAVGTAHPAIRLFDIRSGLDTHSLPGHNGAIYSLAWSPKTSHILASGSADGRVLIFDIRRANAAFASLDLDDAIGVVGDLATGVGSRAQLSWTARAHSGPVTGVQWTASGDKLVTTGHDQRIRVWDTVTGRSDLVHFGPRIRCERAGELKPLITPIGCCKPGREVLFWPNDDGKGNIFMHSLREGTMLSILRTQGISRGLLQAKSQSRQNAIGRLTSGGRINATVWRSNAESGGGIEMYSAHGDGRICMWTGLTDNSHEEDEEVEARAVVEAVEAETEQERKRKRKRDLVGDLVQGLTKRPAQFV